LAAGGKGVAMPLSDAEKKIAEHLAPILNARGLFLVGLDLIGGYVTEINVTSPTCFVEITDQSGFDVPHFWLTKLEKALS
jgi:glutathione synthase